MPTRKPSPYKKPPIVEAVIAVHFSVPLHQKEIDVFARMNRNEFPFSEKILSLETAVNLQTEQPISTAQKIGLKLSNEDRTRLVLIHPRQFGVIQRAPYSGWDTFYKEARAYWDSFKKIIGHTQIARVSTRYVNRIDIPVDVGGQIDLRRYFSVGPSLPDYAETMSLQNFSVSCALLHSDSQFINMLHFAAVPSPLIDHLSFTIDIDVASGSTVPQRDDELWKLIDSLRAYKNDLFEACITDETRRRFQW